MPDKVLEALEKVSTKIPHKPHTENSEARKPRSFFKNHLVVTSKSTRILKSVLRLANPAAANGKTPRCRGCVIFAPGVSSKKLLPPRSFDV